jgi:radical SAM superfamily enzyme YgiQ (UPF0313 family)
VRLLRRYDIVCQGMLMVGLPSDSPRTFEQKVHLVKRLDIDFPVFVNYTPFPGTAGFDEAVARGWLELPVNYAYHDMAHAVMPTEKMTRRQVYNYTGWAFSSAYLDPIRLVRNVFSRNDWRRHWWRQMLAYIGKQILLSLVPRF